LSRNKKPKILLTNDDGIKAPGLKHLWRGLRAFADIYIVAPSKEQSGAGLAITTMEPIHIEEFDWAEGTPAWSVTGTPADCVKMGVSIILKEAPDLVVSGINRGSNAGRNLLYSGTVGGAIEAVMRGIPGIAISSVDLYEPNFELAEKYITQLIQYVLESPLPAGALLNVNFPSKFTDIKGFRFARQGRGYWMEHPDARQHPHGATYYWLGGKIANFEEEHDSDIALLFQGYATAVPVQVGELTDHGLLQERKANFENYFLQQVP
jgi:5'-nucleotidase